MIYVIPQRSNIILKLFADEVKLYSEVYSTSDDNLQIWLNNIVKWADLWQLKLSSSKCFVLPIGKSMVNTVYKINETRLLKAVSNTDLGVEIYSFLIFDQHIDKTCNTAKQRAAIILKCFMSRNPALLVKAFITCRPIRPMLQYACNVWSPFQLIHIDKLEHVQRYFTKHLKDMYNLSYGERLLNLGLESLDVRRLRSNLVMHFKILYYYVDLQFTDFFKINNN